MDIAAAARPAAGTRRRGLAYYARRTVYYLLGAYLLFCLALFVFQRALIYPAMREAAIDPARAGFASSRARVFALATSDGVTLGGWHVLPEGLAAASADEFDAALKAGGLVDLFFHGNGGHRGHRADLYHFLASAGLHAVAFDYRGYGESGGSPTEEGLAADARAALDWLAKRGVAPARIVLHGESLGSAVAVRLAAELCQAGTPPAGLILEAPFTSLGDAAAAAFWFVPARWILRERYPSLERIGAVNCPLLVFHGARDVVVPIALGRRLFAAAPEHALDGSQKTFVVLDSCGHNDLRDLGGAACERACREFFAARIRKP